MYPNLLIRNASICVSGVCFVRDFICKYLDLYFDERTPQEFYRSIFPIGELEERGKQEQGKYNAIAVELLAEPVGDINAFRHIITDDLLLIDELLKSNNFIIISPISYAGKSRVSTNARFIYAIAIDLDGITEEKYIRDLFYQIDNEILPKPTYTVFSGTGLHLYYQLEQAIPCYENIVKQLSVLKKALTQRIWNKYTTSLYDKPQIESLFQGFRIVGGITKDGNRTRVFETGQKVSIEYLNSFVDDKEKVVSFQYKSKLSLDKAKEKYPEWYQNRVIEKKPKGGWTTKRDLFDWWVRRIKTGASVGHRYFCIMTLAVYAVKAGISREELEKTAFDLVLPFDSLTMDKDNSFTREDVLSALEAYNDKYIRFSIDSISSLTNIKIDKNKRNFRKQKLHLDLARRIKQGLREADEMKPEGRPRTKDKIVREWRRQNPQGRKADCIRATGLSRHTINNYWEECAPEQL